MTLLLDTHTFLWFCQDHPLLSPAARSTLEDPTHQKVLSIASCWEIAIKVGLGKLTLGESVAVYIPNALERMLIDTLPIALNHAIAVETLPFHHRDPFDRMLIAQAKIENFPIVSRDATFDAYGITRIW